jgi:hypothetical protein
MTWRLRARSREGGHADGLDRRRVRVLERAEAGVRRDHVGVLKPTNPSPAPAVRWR